MIKIISIIIGIGLLPSCGNENGVKQAEESNQYGKSKIITSRPQVSKKELEIASTIKKKYLEKRDSVVNLIWNSDKVQKRDKEIRELSGNTRNLSILEIDSDNEIFVKLVEDNGLSLVTHLMFIVEPNDQWKIYYYEPITDQQIDFDVWVMQEE
jgi:hypothetical protein